MPRNPDGAKWVIWRLLLTVGRVQVIGPAIMKTLWCALIVPALVAGLGYCLYAQDADKREAGKVLLLKNGHVMEGDIEKIGAQVRVRKGASEIWLAADTAARICADWEDAFLFMQTLIKPESAGDRVRLARWCNMHNMNERALEQARIALVLDPNHAGAKQISTLLERNMQQPAVKSTAPALTPVNTPVKSEPTPFADVTAETRIAFTTKAQPILMNACARCHASGAGGKFVLQRVAESGQKIATQHNLSAVLSYIDLERPAISPILAKAVTPHGDADVPPIKNRSAKAFVALNDWVSQTIAGNPQLKEYSAARKGTPAKSAPTGKSTFGSQQSSSAPSVRETPTVAQQPPAAQPRDEFDPTIFNDFYHPRVTLQRSASSR
jgi:hypothetical protein